MHDPSLMAVNKSLQDLEEEMLHIGCGEWSTVQVQVFLKVQVEVFEDQVKFVTVRSGAMHNVLQLHNVRMSQLL